MAAGRKPKPDALKQLLGTAQPCRMNPDQAPAAKMLPVAPEWLSSRSAEIFADLVTLLEEMKIASGSDAVMLSMLSSRIEEVEQLTAIIEDGGRVYVSKEEQTIADDGSIVTKRMVRARPEVGMRNEALRHVQSLLAEFGLSPAARSRVSAGKSDDGPGGEFDF